MADGAVMGFQAPQRNNDQACGAVGGNLWVVEWGNPTWSNPTTGEQTLFKQTLSNNTDLYVPLLAGAPCFAKFAQYPCISLTNVSSLSVYVPPRDVKLAWNKSGNSSPWQTVSTWRKREHLLTIVVTFDICIYVWTIAAKKRGE